MIQWWEGGWGEVPDKLVVQGGCDSPDPAGELGGKVLLCPTAPYAVPGRKWQGMGREKIGKEHCRAAQAC